MTDCHEMFGSAAGREGKKFVYLSFILSCTWWWWYCIVLKFVMLHASHRMIVDDVSSFIKTREEFKASLFALFLHQFDKPTL